MKFLLPIFLVVISFAEKIELFNGNDLTGWLTQGTGVWSVENGEIKGGNPDRNWAHLVTVIDTFNTFDLRLSYKNITGNTGLYYAAKVEGSFGVSGMQVELGSTHDGSIMWVTDLAWGFDPGSEVVESTPVDVSGEWNLLEINVTDSSYETWINSTPILKKINPQTVVRKSGAFALQLHAGANNEVYFKNIEVFVPKRISGCIDSTFFEFNPEANDPDTSACQTPVPIKGFPHLVPNDGLVFYSWGFKLDLDQKRLWNSVLVYNLNGTSIPIIEIEEGEYNLISSEINGIYLVKIGNKYFTGFMQRE